MGALVGQHAAHHLGAAVEGGGAVGVIAALVVVGAIDHAAHLAPRQGSGAPQARLDGDIEGSVGQLLAPQGRAGKGARCWNFLKNGSAGARLAGALRLTGERTVFISQGSRVTAIPSSAFPVLSLSDKGKPIVLVVPMLNDWVTEVR